MGLEGRHCSPLLRAGATSDRDKSYSRVIAAVHGPSFWVFCDGDKSQRPKWDETDGRGRLDGENILKGLLRSMSRSWGASRAGENRLALAGCGCCVVWSGWMLPPKIRGSFVLSRK